MLTCVLHLTFKKHSSHRRSQQEWRTTSASLPRTTSAFTILPTMMQLCTCSMKGVLAVARWKLAPACGRLYATAYKKE